MSRNLATVLILTLITVIAWVTFQLFKLQTASTIPQPTQKQMESLDPNLDTDVLEELKEVSQ